MLLEQRPSAQTHAKGLQGSQLGTDPHRCTRTDRPAPVLPLPLSWRQWFSKEPARGPFAVQFPHSQPMALQTHLTPSRQLCGGSCLNHLKADGWARICCRPPGSEEVAAPGPGHRLRQMDCFPGHPHTGSGGGPAAPRWALKQSPGLWPSFPQRVTHLSGHRDPTTVPTTS